MNLCSPNISVCPEILGNLKSNTTQFPVVQIGAGVIGKGSFSGCCVHIIAIVMQDDKGISYANIVTI